MPDGKRLWRTEDGDLVEDGHPDARLLAYGEDDPLSEEDEGSVRKQAAQPPNKAVRQPRNKSKG